MASLGQNVQWAIPQTVPSSSAMRRTIPLAPLAADRSLPGPPQTNGQSWQRPFSLRERDCTLLRVFSLLPFSLPSHRQTACTKQGDFWPEHLVVTPCYKGRVSETLPVAPDYTRSQSYRQTPTTRARVPSPCWGGQPPPPRHLPSLAARKEVRRNSGEGNKEGETGHSSPHWMILTPPTC